MLVADFCRDRLNNFPEGFYDSLLLECPDCGYPTEMSETLTQLHCSNPRCKAKLVKRLVAMANMLGVKDLGESKAGKFIDKIATYGITNPIAIFAYDPADDGALDGVSLEVCDKIAKQFQAKKKMTLPEYIKLANLPNIQTSAISIFDGYDDIKEAYKKIESEGISYITSKLGINKDEENISIRALKIYDSLMTFKDELLAGVECVEIAKTVHLKKFKAVCSDEVGVPFKTKADFYSTVNNTLKNIHVDFLSSVTKDIDYLVWAGADGSPARYTNKVKKVEAYNSKGCNIPIVTASQFLKMMMDLDKE